MTTQKTEVQRQIRQKIRAPQFRRISGVRTDTNRSRINGLGEEVNQQHIQPAVKRTLDDHN